MSTYLGTVLMFTADCPPLHISFCAVFVPLAPFCHLSTSATTNLLPVTPACVFPGHHEGGVL